MSKFDTKDKVDGLLYKSFNLISDMIYFFKFRVRSETKLNQKFKDRHRGKRCFILGTGPSLGDLPKSFFSSLSDETIFAVNSLYKADFASCIYPDYYVLVDTKYLGVSSGEYSNICQKFLANPPVLITDYRAKNKVKGLDGFSDVLWLHQKHYPVNSMRVDISRNSSITMNVIGTAIQSAIYMGFSEIYLLGCDYNAFCNFGYGHCYDDTEETKKLKQPHYNLGFYLKYYWLTTEFHYLLRKCADSNGVNIVNLTERSLLDAYERRSLETVFSLID